MQRSTAWMVALLGIFILMPKEARAGPEEDLAGLAAPLGLPDCVQFALAHYSSPVVAIEQVRQAQEGLRQANAPFYPRVSGDWSYQRGEFSGQSRGFTVSRTGTIENNQASLVLSYTILDVGQREIARRRAASGLASFEARLTSTRQELIYSVTQAYLELLRTQRLEGLAQEQVKQAEEQLRMVEAQIAAGAAADVDRYPLEVQLANARVSLIQATNRTRQANTSLRNTMGLDIGPALQIQDIAPPEPFAASLEDALARAEEMRPDLRTARLQLQDARAAAKLAELNRRPLLSVNSSYQEGLSNSPVQRQWSITADLTVPLFDAGSRRSQAEEAHSAVRSQEADLARLVQQVAADVQLAYLDAQAAQERIGASDVLATQAKRNLEAATAKYQNKMAIALEVVNAQVAYFDAQAQAVQARYDLALALAGLARAIGEGD